MTEAGRAGVVAAAVTLVVGDEELLATRAVGEAVAAVVAADQDADVVEVAAGELRPGELSERVSPSLFAARRVVIVRDVSEIGKEVASELLVHATAPADDVHLVVTHPGGSRGRPLLEALARAGARRVDCARLGKPSEREHFVREELRRAGRQVTDEAVRALLDAVGSDLRELAAACAQLVTDTTGAIDAAVVSRYYSGRAEVTGFEVADRAVEGRAARALEALRWALASGTPEVMINGALAGTLRSLGRLSSAPSGLRDADLARQLGVPPWKLRPLRGQLRGWTDEGLTAAIMAVARADLEIKGGAESKGYALERAILAVAVARASGPRTAAPRSGGERSPRID